MPQTAQEDIAKLAQKVQTTQLPPELLEKVNSQLTRLERMVSLGSYSNEYEATSRYIDWVVSIPWNTKTNDLLDLTKAREIFDKNHYGLDPIKTRIIEYLSVLKLQLAESAGVSRAPILFLIGLVGTGKTTMAISIAEAMGREFIRIPFGGMGDSIQLRGQSRAYPDAEPGLIVKALRRAKSRNPVLLLDEVDRVSTETRNDIMGVLVELLDPEQNSAFTDHYLDFPVNLSDVLFVATANNTGNIATAVMDRLEPIQMPSYTDEEKLVIAQKYIFPKVIKASGLSTVRIAVDDDVWAKIIRPLGFDGGMRSLERTINGIARRIAFEVIQRKTKDFHITSENIKDFVPSW